MRKIYIYIIVGIIILATGGYFVIGGNNNKTVKYRTEKVTRGNVVVQVKATGVINPVRTVAVGSQVSGTIAKLFVDYNSKVREGEVIAIIDSTFLYASVKEAQANLDRNQAQVNQAKRDLDRAKALFAKSLNSQADLDAAQTTYESDVAQLSQTQAALDRAIVNLRFAVIRSPIDGVVINRAVDVGQTVAASLQTPTLFSIANDLTHMQVETSVDEADIGQIKEDQLAMFTVDAYPNEQFRGRVWQIRLAPITVQNVVTYTVVIEVQNPDLKLRPGMTATVSIMIDKHENVLRIPTIALRFQPPQDMSNKNGDQSSQPPIASKSNIAQNDRSQQHDSSSGHGGRGMGSDSSRGHWMGRGDQSGADSRPSKITQIWVLDAVGNIKPVQVTLGLNDNRYVEITSDQIKEGDDIVLSSSGTETTQASQQTNPFAPRSPMGGPGGRGGR
ncbi:MAG: efflux RND transporter periplasmic adaptor subunit [Bacteroidota bacterium]